MNLEYFCFTGTHLCHLFIFKFHDLKVHFIIEIEKEWLCSSNNFETIGTRAFYLRSVFDFAWTVAPYDCVVVCFYQS